MLDIVNKTKEYSSLLTISSIGASLTLIILVLLSSFYKDMPLILTNVLLALTITLLTFTGYLFTVHNKKQNQELLTLSNKDQLTGLKNKELLHEKINETVEKHLRVAQISTLDDANSWLGRTDASLFGAYSTGGNSTFLAIPEERSLKYELEPFFSKKNPKDDKEEDEKVVSLKSFRKKKLIDSETTL